MKTYLDPFIQKITNFDQIRIIIDNFKNKTECYLSPIIDSVLYNDSFSAIYDNMKIILDNDKDNYWSYQFSGSGDFRFFGVEHARFLASGLFLTLEFLWSHPLFVYFVNFIQIYRNLRF